MTAVLLAEEYRAEATEQAVPDLVEVVTGASAVAHRFLQLQLSATEEVRALVTAKPAAVNWIDNETEERAADRGVPYRVVIEREVLSMPAAMTELAMVFGRH